MHASHGLATRLFPVAVAALVAACASGSPGLSPTPTTPPLPAASSSATPTAAPSAAPSAASPSGTPATAHQSLHVLGSGIHPGITVVGPAGWNTSDGHFMIKPGPVLGLSVWDVGQVPKDPCHWSTTLRDPGPGVDGLVKALVAQTGRHATTPKTVTLAGQSGKYLEWSVPDWVVTGDADFAGCDDPGNGHHDFVSWFATDQDGERYEQVPGQVDRLWVLDVKGQQLVVDATYSPDTTSVDRAELGSVVASLRFVEP
jgi:hypothetical protein